MTDSWNERAVATLAQFDHQLQAGPLLYTLQQFRTESTKEPTNRRREILNAGRPLAARASEALKETQVAGDTVGLMVEAGLYLLECARPTIEEYGAPPEMTSGRQPNDRLGPNLVSEDFTQGISLMTQGFARGMATGGNMGQLNALRDYIIDTAKGLVMITGEFEKDSQRLGLLCWITQELEDNRLFTVATTELSGLLRNAQQPEGAEAVVRKALKWPLLEQEQLNALKVELASALSEQGKYAEAEAIQRELLEG